MTVNGISLRESHSLVQTPNLLLYKKKDIKLEDKLYFWDTEAFVEILSACFDVFQSAHLQKEWKSLSVQCVNCSPVRVLWGSLVGIFIRSDTPFGMTSYRNTCCLQNVNYSEMQPTSACVCACDITWWSQTAHYSRCHFIDENTVNLCTIPKPFILNERWQQRESETDRGRQRERHQKKVTYWFSNKPQEDESNLPCCVFLSPALQNRKEKKNTTNALKPTLGRKHRGASGVQVCQRKYLVQIMKIQSRG